MNPQNEFTPSAPMEGGGAGTAAEATSRSPDKKNKLSQTARDAAAKVKSAASATAAKAKDEAQKIVTTRKDSAAETIGSYSSAIHDSAKSIEEKDPNIAWFTHRAADRLQGVADYLRGTDFNGLRRDGENLARRHPAAFFGGMFVAGLLVGNFVKATAHRANGRGEFAGDERHARDDDQTEFGGSETPAENHSTQS